MRVTDVFARFLIQAVALGLLPAVSPLPARAGALTAADVEQIISQGAAEAARVGLPVSIAVVDREGNVLGGFRMDGARNFTVIDGKQPECDGTDRNDCGLDGVRINPLPASSPFGPLSGSMLAAISKAGTAAFFGTRGNAFTPRTASFIIQPHFPPGIKRTASGPLFGVQFSSLLCSDVNPRLPLGLSADPGAFPLYQAGDAAGGVGVEGNGRYTFDRDPRDKDTPPEDRIAVAAAHGFAAPKSIRATQITLLGIRFPFANVTGRTRENAPPFSSLSGVVEVPPRDSPSSRFVPFTLGGVPGEFDPAFFPPIDSIDPPPGDCGTTAPANDCGLTADEVLALLTQGAREANRLRAAIRRPLGARAKVNVAIVDAGGNVLGLFRTEDAPLFGMDVSVQKARTAALLSRPDAAERLLAAPNVKQFVMNARRDGLRLDGAVALSDRAVGFLSRPFFPDGIDGTSHGPFSRPIAVWSPFNTGLQVELVKPAIAAILAGGAPPDCTGVPGIENGIQIFGGSVPLYRGSVLVGGAGVSGDGVEQDDAVAVAASRGFQAPGEIRSDRVKIRNVRLPFIKLPRKPTTR